MARWCLCNSHGRSNCIEIYQPFEDLMSLSFSGGGLCPRNLLFVIIFPRQQIPHHVRSDTCERFRNVAGVIASATWNKEEKKPGPRITAGRFTWCYL
jgi:hypothetical protein